jgi:hypothetical protein
MRRALKLLLLLGIGLALMGKKGGPGGTPGNFDKVDIPPKYKGLQGNSTPENQAAIDDKLKDGDPDGSESDVQDQTEDMWNQHNATTTPTVPEDLDQFGKYTPGGDEWNESGVSLDELTELTASHSDVDNPNRNRPNRAQIEDALRNGDAVKLDGQNAVKIKYNGVVVIINYDDTTRSTTYFPGIDGGA